MSVASWCRACGAPAEGDGSPCAQCGTPLDESDPGLPRIGLVAVVEWRRVLATEPADTIAVLGECLGASGDAAELADRVDGELRDLREAMDIVLGSQWDAALAAGNDLAGRAGLPAIRAEALNIAAFCQCRLGDVAAALRTLGAALDGGPAVSPSETGLLINASVMAAAAGSPAAMPYLA